MARSAVLTGLVVVLGACVITADESGTSRLELDIDKPNPLAVDSKMNLEVVETNCGIFVGPCGARADAVFEHRVEPEGLFEVVRNQVVGSTQFNATVLAEGTARFSVDVVTGGERGVLAYDLVAKTIDRVSVQTSCSSPALMQGGIATSFSYQMWNGSQRLNGYLVPFSIAGGASLVPGDDLGETRLQLPAAAGTVTITSTYDTDFIHVIDVAGRDSIDGLALSNPSSQLVVGSSSDISAELLVGARSICGGSMPITSAVTTPDQCALEAGYGSFSHTIRIRGIAPGDCTVSVGLVGTALSATKTFSVIL